MLGKSFVWKIERPKRIFNNEKSLKLSLTRKYAVWINKINCIVCLEFVEFYLKSYLAWMIMIRKQSNSTCIKHFILFLFLNNFSGMFLHQIHTHTRTTLKYTLIWCESWFYTYQITALPLTVLFFCNACSTPQPFS